LDSSFDALTNSAFTDSVLRRPSSTRSLLEISKTRNRYSSTSSTASSSSPRLKHPISYKNRQLVQSCFRNPHELLGKRILKKTRDKKPDFDLFLSKLDGKQRDELEESIKVLLKKVVANIDFIDEVQRLGEEFGANHVQFRKEGFKPEFFGIYADAAVTECTFLDSAVHPPHQTLDAFSSFISWIFSFVRDGYYGEMRRSRRISSAISTGSTSSRKSGKLSVGSIADHATRLTLSLVNSF
uniref:GLOBIN domain-containing protein n=1 Tax=Syphacia muris TaxID=451379 RepID=A0A0N5AZ47_9BILA